MSFLKKILPPDTWRIPVIIIAAIFTGLALYSLHISRALSYLGDKPETCVNCHIMAPQYATWSHSAHREVTNCNDCHVPHNNIFNKYYFKAKDGLRHATIFTLRNEPQVIFIKEEGKEAVHKNCIRCHEDLITDTRLLGYTDQTHLDRMERDCMECHMETPHGDVNSISSVPYARVPLPEQAVPPRLRTMLQKQ